MNITATLIAQSIVFLSFVWFCMKYVWPPIMTALHDRKAKIADGLAAAERGQHAHELAEKRATEALKEAKEKANEIIANAQKRASEIVEASKGDARSEGERIITAARAEVEQESHKAREELRRSVAELAIVGAAQVLMSDVDAGKHNELLEKLAAEL